MQAEYLVPTLRSGRVSVPAPQTPLPVEPGPLGYCDLGDIAKATEPQSCHTLPTLPVLSFQLFQTWVLRISCLASQVSTGFVKSTGISRLPVFAAYVSQPRNPKRGGGWSDGCLLTVIEKCPLSPSQLGWAEGDTAE